MYLSAVQMKSQRRPDEMESLNACSSRIDDKHVTSGITDHFQYMGMSAYEYIRTVSVYQFTGARVIASGVSADMSHQHLHSLTFKETVQRMNVTQVVVVTIARNTYQRLETAYFLCQFHSPAKISGVPYLVHGLEEVLELPAEDAVRV